MRLPDPFRADGEHIGADLPGGRVLFTTRRGGVSSGPFESLNLGRTSPWSDGDDAPDRVIRNREILAAQAGLPWTRFAHAHQVHGTTVARAGVSGGETVAEADGQATDQAGMAALVLVADCLPVALVSPTAVAMIHAGWRGLAGGIIAEGMRAVRELGGEQPVQAALGPGARGCCYAVGEQVRTAFAGVPGAHRDGRLDLAFVARTQLERAGAGLVHDVGLCTICSEPGLFFSHRRDRGVTGRQGGITWRT